MHAHALILLLARGTICTMCTPSFIIMKFIVLSSTIGA